MNAARYVQGVAIATLLTAATLDARGDQCALVASKEVAVKAASYLTTGAEYVPYCELCGDAAPTAAVVRDATARRTGDGWEVVLNGQPIDLAYVYVRDRVRNDGFANLADLAGCDASDVSLFLANSRVTAAPGAATAAPGVESLTGSTMTVAAPAHFSKSNLGTGFDQDLRQGVETVPLAGTTTVSETPITKASYRALETTFELAANANYLFAQARVGFKHDERYMVVSIVEESRQETFRLDEGVVPRDPIVLTGIHYGWAAYLVIHGSEESFDANMKAKVATKWSAAVRTELTERGVSVDLYTVGLSRIDPRNVEVPLSLEDVNRLFTKNAKPAPVLADYTVMQAIRSSGVEWRRPLVPGTRYEVNIDVELTPLTVRGNLWDGDGSGPDPTVTWFFDGKEKATCGTASNTFKVRCRFFVTPEHETLRLTVVDRDSWEAKEKVGSTLELQLVGRKVELDKPVALEPVDGILSAVMTVTRP